MMLQTLSVQMDPCEVVLGITLEETECHIASPTPLEQCTTRSEEQTVS